MFEEIDTYTYIEKSQAITPMHEQFICFMYKLYVIAKRKKTLEKALANTPQYFSNLSVIKNNASMSVG